MNRADRQSGVLAVDIGNTSVQWGLCRGGRVFQKGLFLTCVKKPVTGSIPSGLKVQAAVISSVVPARTYLLKTALRKLLGIPVYVLGDDMNVPIRNGTRHPAQVGVDRLVNSFAAHRLFGACVVVDFGTAITFDVVSKNGIYKGGVIAPGIELTLRSLAKDCALLPKIKPRHVNSVIGRDTVSCIRSGAAFGLGGLCDRVLELIIRHTGNPVVVATGGYAGFMSKYSRFIRRVVPNLTLLGIDVVYRHHRRTL